MNDVREFLMAIDHTLIYEIVPISDPFGPTRTDPDIDVMRRTIRNKYKLFVILIGPISFTDNNRE